MKRNWKELISEEQKHVLRNFSVFLVIFTIFFLICILLGSCKSVKTEVQYQYRDSVITHYVTDTTHVTVVDTTHVEISSDSQKENETEIHFGEGGGTYNAQTGVATNVISVKQSSKEKELQSMVLTQKNTIDSLAAANNLLQQSISEIQDNEHHEENTNDRSRQLPVYSP